VKEKEHLKNRSGIYIGIEDEVEIFFEGHHFNALLTFGILTICLIIIYKAYKRRKQYEVECKKLLQQSRNNSNSVDSNCTAPVTVYLNTEQHHYSAGELTQHLAS